MDDIALGLTIGGISGLIIGWTFRDLFAMMGWIKNNVEPERITTGLLFFVIASLLLGLTESPFVGVGGVLFFFLGLYILTSERDEPELT